MTGSKRLWVPVVVAVMAGALIGPAGATEQTPEPRAVEYSIMLSGSAFQPTNDDLLGFQNDGYQMVVVSPAPNGEFVAPLVFDHPDVRVKKLVLWAYDNNLDANACVSLYRAIPSIGNDQFMGNVCSTGGTTGIRRFVTKSLDIRRANEKHAPYLWLYLPGTYGNGYSFYGVQVIYTVP